MAALKSSASPLILHHFLNPFAAIRLPSFPLRTTTSLSSRSLLFTSPSLSLSSHPLPLPPHSLSTSQTTLEPIIKYETGEIDDEDDEFETEIEDSESEEDTVLNSSPSAVIKELNTKLPLPNLTVKEKKELASYAHSLGKKLKSQQVGKSGVTDSVATALIETLESNELLKLKIHNSCPGDLDDVVKQLEKATGSIVVGQIGRTVILYRPSLTKLKAEEKKKQAMSVFTRKLQTPRPSFECSSVWKKCSVKDDQDYPGVVDEGAADFRAPLDICYTRPLVLFR
ncbi:RNA-binding CRS1 / YhbY (CRM) domain protein [Actinidia rufa]|uniref:RNA-binding CRS1 / YhbY (CRM) domain protein n=1 Tax=Actinidia rufa TaxID=165716 RepID=A0A7J0F6V2_9ERIC|nr:RNA-binding CRS1 / YhbY (CRM) domain protein [Actinidia rufa]